MDFREFTGLLQDHISWYQDGYFTYLLEHVHQAASRVHNSEEEAMKNKADESDDEIMIVKEVKGGTKAEHEIAAAHTETKAGESKEANNEVVNNEVANNEEEKSVGRAEGNCVKEAKLDTNEKHDLHDINENDGKDKKMNDKDCNATVKVDSNCVTKDRLDADKNQGLTRQHEKKENQVGESKCDQNKKSSPTSDNSRKSKNRKRKPAKQVNASDDSDEELIQRNAKLSKKRMKNDKNVTNFVDKNENDSGDVKGKINEKELFVQRSGFMKGSAEDTAKWVLQLPSIEGEHSEDPEDGSDDEDSETQLELTYGLYFILIFISTAFIVSDLFGLRAILVLVKCCTVNCR